MVHILRSTSLWGGGGLPDTIMPTFRGGGGKKYPKMYYVVCERSLIMHFNSNFISKLFSFSILLLENLFQKKSE